MSCWCIFPWPTYSLHFSCLLFYFTRTWASPWLLLLNHPLPRMFLAAEGEGDEDEFGRQREQAEEMSHSHRNGMQVGSELPCFHKPPELSQSVSSFFKRCGLVSNLFIHSLLRRWVWISLESREFFTWLVCQPPQCLLILLAKAIVSLSKAFSLIRIQYPNSPNSLSIYQTFSPLDRKT